MVSLFNFKEAMAVSTAAALSPLTSKTQIPGDIQVTWSRAQLEPASVVTMSSDLSGFIIFIVTSQESVGVELRSGVSLDLGEHRLSGSSTPDSNLQL